MTDYIYVCISVHGAFIPSRSTSYITSHVSTIDPPRGLEVMKFTITVPGTTGQNFSDECAKANTVLSKNPSYDPEKMTALLTKTFQKTIPDRKANSQLLRNDKESMFGDTAANSAGISGVLETGKLVNKSFQVEPTPSLKLYSVKILNGQYRGQNIIEYDFLSQMSILHALQIDDSRFETLKNGKKLLINFTLDELLNIILLLGIRYVYIIDPSCAVDDDNLESLRANRYARLVYSKDVNSGIMPDQNQFVDHYVRDSSGYLVPPDNTVKPKKGKQVSIPEIQENQENIESCKKCPDGKGSFSCCETVKEWLGMKTKEPKYQQVQLQESEYQEPEPSPHSAAYQEQYKYRDAPVKSQKMSSSGNFNQYEDVRVNGKLGSIRSINGNNAVVDFDDGSSNTYKLNEITKIGGSKKTKKNRKNKKTKKNRKNKKYLKKRKTRK
jgi:hypothetical protein